MSLATSATTVPTSLRESDRRRALRDALTPPSSIAVALLAVGVTIWWLSLSSIALNQMTAVGLASVLPLGIWLSFLLVTAGSAIAWRIDSVPLMTAAVLTTIFVLFGLGVLGEPTMRFATTWQHVGITAYVANHGSIDPHIDAYFNWPGFFILGAFITKVAGLHNMIPIARAAPLFYNAMYFLPLVAIGQALFSDRRVVWLGVWLFFVNNWIGQDYYSPQGLAMFMYLVVLAVLLRWFKGSAAGPGQPLRPRILGRLRAFTNDAAVVPSVRSTGSERVVLTGAVILISAEIVASHQLTPFALVTATAALSLIGWNRLRTLSLLILLMTLSWAAYLAWIYLQGHLHSLTGDVGALNTTVTQNVSGRLHVGDPGHKVIVEMRLGMTALLWLTACAGFIRQARAGTLSLGLLVLALSPFPILALQSYGGEVILRIALFSLPFMAFSAASLVLPTHLGPAPKLATAVLLGLVLVFVAAFPFDRYGNEQMDYYSKAELAGVQALYRIAPPGSYLFAADDSLPWRYQDYADYYYYGSLQGSGSKVNLDLRSAKAVARSVAKFMVAPDGKKSYLIITRSTSAESNLFGPWAYGAEVRLRRILTRSRYFSLIYRNRDAIVFELRRAARSIR